MILTGHEIIKQVNLGTIVISPFSINSVNPNSYDISIGDCIYSYRENQILSTDGNMEIETIFIPKEGVILKRHKFYFAKTKEITGSDSFVPILHNRSGVARKGLFVHITSDLRQLGTFDNVMLQLYPEYDILVLPNQKIGQMSFWKIQR